MKDDKSKCRRAIILLLPLGFLLVTIAVHLRTYLVGKEIDSQPKPIPSPSKYLPRESSWSPTTYFPVSIASAKTVSQMATIPHSQTEVPSVQPRNKLILMWTKSFDDRVWPDLPAGVLPCAKYNIHGKCRITYDKKEYEHSDLVIFHGIGFDFNPNNLPDRSKRSPQQRWAYYCRESPVHSGYTATGEPSESRRFLNGLQFNWTMTYKLNSDIENRYYRIVPGRHPGSDEHYFKRSKMAAAVLSNCKEDRLHYIQELQKYMEVDIYGGCGAHCLSGTSCFAFLQEKYKFYLSFENSICKDYVTEKLYRNALMHNMLPVVINGGDMSNPTVAPPGCCIKASDFKGAKELAEYIKKVASNSTLYNSHFKWHLKYAVQEEARVDVLCRACHKLYTDSATKVYYDMYSWYGIKENCFSYPKP